VKPDHGTRARYTLGCKCDDCKRANRDYQRAYRNGARQGRTTPTTAKERPHGTRSRYVVGCRCDPCQEANRAYQREYMKMRRAGIPWVDKAIEDVMPTRIRKKSAAARKVGR
jgi:Zn ribbon nucleic-acid-binding protein